MNFNKLTIKAQEAVIDGQNLARESGHAEYSPEHLLVALLRQDGGIVPPILNKLGVNPSALEMTLARELSRRAQVSGGSEPQPSAGLRKAFDAAFAAADEFKDEYISTEHLLLGITEITRSTAAETLASAGVDQNTLLQALQAVRGSQRVTDQNPEDKYQALER
jgi:ATP-dependent Clp protease ATP-binding subunit ClpB